MGTIDSWSSIEAIIRQRLDIIEQERRYCAVCDRQGPSLSRCFGCQMVYYCGEEHQAEDWLKEHSRKCAQLQWVALGEFIQALPAQPPLPKLGDKWMVPLKDINNWKDWLSIRTNIVNLAHNTANIFQNLGHLSDKRQPTYQNAVDGLLAAVTDLLTHVLTIGKAIVYFGLQPHIRPLIIHILSGFNKIDLIGSDKSSSNLPTRFHELLNMFPDNKGVELLIVIGDDDQDDTDQSIPYTKLKSDRLILTTTGKGRLFDTSEEKRLQRPVADLLVYFNAAHIFSNKVLLKKMLAGQRPTLLTFDDENEFNQAKAFLSTKAINIHRAGPNQFSSLINRQRFNKPNSTYSTNSYQILLNEITMNGNVDRNGENYSLSSYQHSHQSPLDIQNGLRQRQQLNPGLKQVNGIMHSESFSSTLSSSHNTQVNNNGTQLDTNVRIVSSTNTATPIQPLVRSNNNTCQPTIAQRQHQSSNVSVSTSSTMSTTTYRDAYSTTATKMTIPEFARNDSRPQPKPRLSLVKTQNKESEPTASQVNSSIVQRIIPIFEQPIANSTQETKVVKQQRQPVSIPYTYQTGPISRATCLDDLISTQNVSSPMPLTVSTEASINERIETTAAIISTSSSVDKSRDHHTTASNVYNPSQITRSIIERCTDEQPIKPTMDDASTSVTKPFQNYQDKKGVIDIQNNISSRSSPSSNENSSIDRIVTATLIKVSPATSTSNDACVDQSISMPANVPISALPISTNNAEVIYTEVIRNHERPSSSYRTDSIKSPISPSRSFIIPTKSPSISSNNASFNFQRPSRSQFSTYSPYQVNKSKPIQSSMTSDRISLYSQRSNKQVDTGVTIKNLSECIDRVGIVFDETNRSHETPSTGLTTLDIIREQLTTSSATKSNESLLDKLYKSNSSTRLSGKSSRTPLNIVVPRSKSQQTNRIQEEIPTTSKTSPANTPPLTTQAIRRTGVTFLPLTPKNVQAEQISSVPSQQTSTLVYQNLELPNPTNDSNVSSTSPDYTLKQPVGPVCTGVPKPFRKPTAIIEPSPVIVPTPTANTIEPDYVNLMHQDEHIYTNESNPILPSSSNSNSYTSKTSSIYSSTDKHNLSTTNPEPLYAITNIPLTQQEQTVDYDSFDDDLVIDDIAKIEKASHSNDNTDDDSFDDDENQVPLQNTPSKNPPTNFFRSTLNRLTRSNKSLERLNNNQNETVINDFKEETNPSNIVDIKTKKTLRSIKARREAKRTGALFYTGDDDTTSIDSNCSTQTATSLNKSTKLSHSRFRLFRRKIEKEFASDTEAEKQQTEQRRKKWNKKIQYTADELKTKRLLMMSDDDDDDNNNNNNNNKMNSNNGNNLNSNQNNKTNDDTHIYDHIIHDEINNHLNSSRMGKLSHETHMKPATVTLDEIRSEIQAEIAARQDAQSTNQASNFNLQKKRSKSVTFLDELLDGEDGQQKQSDLIRKNDNQSKPSTTAKRIEKGDARSICGALTGTGPIRGIIKAANNDITGTTAPVSPSAAAAIYLSGTSIDTRCTSPKVNERTHRPLSTYTVGSARFYDGAPVSSTPTYSSSNQNTNHRPILSNASHQSTSENAHNKRPTAKVSPFQTKSPNDTSPSSPSTANKQIILSSTTKKPIRPIIQRNMHTSHDIASIATSSVSNGVGGVSKRLQSNF